MLSTDVIPSRQSRGTGWVLTQLALFAIFIFLPRTGPPWPSPALFRFAGLALLALGCLPLVGGALALGRKLTPFPQPAASGRLITSGFYRIVRHPMYLGVLLCVLGWALRNTSLLQIAMTVVLLFFLDRKCRHEEELLRAAYPEYIAYAAQVKKLIPGIY